MNIMLPFHVRQKRRSLSRLGKRHHLNIDPNTENLPFLLAVLSLQHDQVPDSTQASSKICLP